jgi:capsular polysaccharide transport system permease protein
MGIRSSWVIMQTSILALITRNIQKRFITSAHTDRSIGFLWIFIEPMLHVALWTCIRWFQGTSEYNGMPLPLFILLGAIPWLFTRHVIMGSISIIKSEKGLFIFRQIKPIDLYIARLLSELAVETMVFIIFLFLFTWFGVEWETKHLLFWFANIVSYFIFITGCGLITAVLGFFFGFVNFILKFLMRALYLLSGIFFSAQMIPLSLRKYFLLNPVFQIVEISRECFYKQQIHDQFVDPVYLFKCAIVAITLGFAIYISCRDRIHTVIAQRT